METYLTGNGPDYRSLTFLLHGLVFGICRKIPEIAMGDQPGDCYGDQPGDYYGGSQYLGFLVESRPPL